MTSTLQNEMDQPPTLGEILRRQRNHRGVSLRHVAHVTKIRVRYLEAMERDDLGALPGGAFNKGFLRAYATCVGLDPEEIVSHYLLEAARRNPPPEPEGRQGSEGRRRQPAGLALTVGAALAILLAAVYLVWLRG